MSHAGTIIVNSLSKVYGTSFVLGPLNLSFRAGETIAILGKNGSGKSTFFELLSGSLDASSGEILYDAAKMNPDAPQLKRLLGYLPQNLEFPRWVSGLDVLAYSASLHALPQAKDKVKQSLEYWDAIDFATKPLAACSHGMMKRIGLAAATLHNPPYLILDEPFSGLDLSHIKALQGKIRERSLNHKLTILSTHIAPYVAALCQRVFMIKQGMMTELTQWEHRDFLRRIDLIETSFFE